PPPTPTLLPYTTLFRSAHQQADGGDDTPAHPGVANLLGDALQLVFLGPETEILNSTVREHEHVAGLLQGGFELGEIPHLQVDVGDRKSTRLNSSHLGIS